MAKNRVCLLLLPLLGALGCAEPPQFLPSYQPGGPQGVLGGTVTYTGPLPCTENHHVLGGAVFLAFSTGLLPPPEGLGTTAASLATLPGDVLFGGIFDQLTFNADDLADPAKSIWCPPDGTSVTVSGSWTVGALPGGEYEVRAFYDLHGQFDPAFKISTLPHQGDIAGGAIDNVPEVLMGAAPVYRRITLGTKHLDAMGQFTGAYDIPPQGSNIDGIAVTLGLPLPLGLPIFYPSQVLGSTHACSSSGMVISATPPSTDPRTLTLPSDYQLPVFSVADPAGTEDSILRIRLTAGVATGVPPSPGVFAFPSEVAAASASPFDFPVGPPRRRPRSPSRTRT